METAQEGEARQELAEVDSVATPLLGAEEVRASLEAVRRAQTAARARARRETRWARLIALGALMAIGATAWAAARRPQKARVVAPVSAVAAVATPQAAPAPAIAGPPLEAPPAEQPAPPAAAERSAAAIFGNADGKVALCDAAFEQRNWTAIAATCPPAFEARPGKSALAMRVAQAEHRRGYIANAADWAHKALALDADIPEAFVIIAHAEAGAGHTRAAADAYKRYLTLAPRGWHAAEARRAVRAAR